jgi:2,4-dienoyl-CoA reductase-like NADH-dependent reductase (Old Yellow Enzyme family)
MSTLRYPHLFSAGRIGNVALKNRAIVAPIPFDPAMTSPLATVANTVAWRTIQAA